VRAPSSCPLSRPACRRSASAVWLGDGQVTLLLGRDADRFFDDEWTFDLRTRKWGATA
jgi:hypothetical protein